MLHLSHLLCEFAEPQEVRLLLKLKGHHPAQALPAFARRKQRAVHLIRLAPASLTLRASRSASLSRGAFAARFLQEEFLPRAPLLERDQPRAGFGTTKAKAFG